MCQNNDSVQTLKCPLCKQEMPLTEIPSPNNGREDKAFAWICSNCPTVAFEWVDDTDSKAFLENLVLPTHQPLAENVQNRKYLECPSCDGIMPRVVVRSNDNGSDSESVKWVCEPCPIIIAYVPEEKDRNALMSYFNDKDEVLHDYNEEVFEELDKVYEELERKQLEQNEQKYVNNRMTKIEFLQEEEIEKLTKKQIVLKSSENYDVLESYLFETYHLARVGNEGDNQMDFNTHSSLVNKFDRIKDLINKIDKLYYPKS